MPTYEYECPQCGVFEVVQSMRDERLQRCPTCKRKIRRLLGTGAGIIFKGAGFYQTDYRGEAYKSAAKADTAPTEGASKTEAKAEAKTEAKPEAVKKESAAASKTEAKSAKKEKA
jgi:putative FmdB family regulatory protein